MSNDFYVGFVLPSGEEICVNHAAVPEKDSIVNFDGKKYKVSRLDYCVHTYPEGLRAPTAAVGVHLEEV